MKIDKCCLYCEFNYGDICASHDTDNDYGWIIDDYKKQRECWESSLDYSILLADQLSEKEKNMYNDSSQYGINDLVRRMETGNW